MKTIANDDWQSLVNVTSKVNVVIKKKVELQG